MYQGYIEGAQTASHVAGRIAIGCEGVNTVISCWLITKKAAKVGGAVEAEEK